MATACIVISDVENDETAMTAVFDGGFDKESPAHAAMRRVLDMIYNLGVEMVDQMLAPVAAVPEPMLVDANGHTMIPVASEMQANG